MSDERAVPADGWERLVQALAGIDESRRLYWAAYVYVGARYEKREGSEVATAARHELESAGTPETLKACDLDIAADLAVAELLLSS